MYDFTTPEGWNEKRVLLYFGGVWSSAEVWLNRQYLGRHDSGYTSFAFNTTGKLKKDEPIRLAHYTPARGFIELCDEMGMYVGNEVSLGGAGDLMYDPSFSNAVLQRSYETVERDINSPSIIYWSIGNEDPLTALHMASVKLVKALDPTRPLLLP